MSGRVFLLEEELKKKNQIKLKEELAKTKIDYFTNVSHEILTPLTVILTVIEFFEKNTFHDQYGKQVNILKRKCFKGAPFDSAGIRFS